MMRIPNNQDLEKLFKTSFENFEPEVNVDVWNKIQKNIPKGAQGVAATSGLGKLAGKLLVGAGAVVTVVATLVYLNSADEPKGSAVTSKIAETTQVQEASTQAQEQAVAPSQSTENTSTVKANNTVKPQLLNKVEPKTQQLFTEKPSVTEDVKQESSAGTIEESKTEENTLNLPIANNTAKSNHKYEHVQDAATVNNPAVNSNTRPSIGATSHSGVFPLTITFSNKGGNKINKWDFGDGTYSTEKSPVHTYEKVGIYKVTLTSEDNSKDVQIIQVLSNIKVNAPNFFSPDGDGINDEFKVTSNDAQSLQVQILDLTGKEIARITSQDGTWDGKNSRNGEACKSGTYLYVVSGTTIDGRQFEHRGSITLKR